jgi:hypothetical protein
MDWASIRECPLTRTLVWPGPYTRAVPGTRDQAAASRSWKWVWVVLLPVTAALFIWSGSTSVERAVSVGLVIVLGVVQMFARGLASTASRYSPHDRRFGPKSPRASIAVALILAVFAVYSAFVAIRSVTAAPPPHGHDRFWVPALVLLALLALCATYGAVRSWQTWRHRR